MPDPGVPAVTDEVRQQLSGLDEQPVGEHAAAYEQVHRLLQDALARLDEG